MRTSFLSALPTPASTTCPLSHTSSVPPNAPISPQKSLDVIMGEGGIDDGLHVDVDREVVQQNAPVWGLDALPPGYRFTPRDDELITFYLQNKIRGKSLPINKIYVVELYDYNPEDLTVTHEQWGEDKWYFFTSRHRKYRNGSRPSRSAGDGYWKATGADRPITRDGKIVGVRKALVFYRGKPPKGDKTNWIMHEFRVIDPNGPRRYDGTMKLDDWVLCTIHEKARDAVRQKGRRVEFAPHQLRRRKKQVSGKEVKLSPASPILGTTSDMPMMYLGLGNNNYQYQSCDNMVYPPFRSLNNDRFLEPRFLQEAFPNGYPYLPVNQSSGAAMHSSVTDYWPTTDNLGHSFQGNLAAPLLDDCQMLADGAGDVDQLGFAGLNSTTDYLLPNPSDGYKFDPLYHSVGCDSLLVTNPMDSSSTCFSSWANGAANVKNDPAALEASATYGFGATSETGAPPETCGTSGTCVSCDDFGDTFGSEIDPSDDE